MKHCVYAVIVVLSELQNSFFFITVLKTIHGMRKIFETLMKIWVEFWYI